MNPIIDLRSDTLTKPTPAMRQAMANAPVGDDVFGEDPTVNKLQQRVAELCGKEAALFVPSGTMSNQIAINAHTQPGDEVICDYNCHIFNYEGGGPALLSGVQIHPLWGERGIISAKQIKAVIRPEDHHFAQTKLIELENTHNRGGGSIFPLEEIKRIRALADEHQLVMHLDGARLWNAHVATGISMADWCAPFESISLCFSKGLGAPVGSMLVGSEAFIDRAHRYRKIYGGGMRQVGVIASAALYALDHHIKRLQEDHNRAHRLGEKLSELGATVDFDATQTNIVIADFAALGRSSAEINSELQKNGVLGIAFSPTRIRFVTHLDVDDKAIHQAESIFEKVLT
jgi:threonine aldolase